jgi:plasmid stability protein
VTKKYHENLSSVPSYNDQISSMTETLTIRLPAAQRRALRARAAAAGRTESALVRELIDLQLRTKGTLGERAGRYLGRLDFEPASLDRDPWRAHLRRINSRP